MSKPNPQALTAEAKYCLHLIGELVVVRGGYYRDLEVLIDKAAKEIKAGYLRAKTGACEEEA